jgi:nucleoid-associated protein YgaU
MIATKGIVVLSAVAVVAVGAAAVFAIQHMRREPIADAKIATAAPTAAKNQAPAALAAVQAEASAVVAALGGTPARPEADDGAPSFDIARIEPTGDAVIAGRAAPGATVELLRDGKVHESTVADQSGQFAMVPPRLPPGSYDLTLRAKQADGKQLTSKQRVAVAFEASPKDQPVVALMTPNKPTVVLSQGAATKPAAGTVAVDAVEVEKGGKFHVSGRAKPGAPMRFYLNDSFVASVTAGGDGRFSVTINEGVAPGSYRVRLDEVEPTSGAVRARAEVPFNVPDGLVTASVPAQAPAAKRPELAAAQSSPAAPPQAATSPQAATGPSTAAQVPAAAQQQAAAQPPAVAPAVPAAAAAPVQVSAPSAVVVEKIVTATVSRGDSLWRISSVTYGQGIRYAVIYKANQEQIRNPNLIYPGQVFVLPTQ